MLLEAKNLKKFYSNQAKNRASSVPPAVNGVSFTIDRGKTLGLVGESGSGKTTTGKLILRLIEPSEGKVFFKGQSILDLSKKAMIGKRKEMQIIFQDPYGSLNPRMTIGSILSEPFEIHQKMKKSERVKASIELLNKVGLSANVLNNYPHEFSGGQRQRICIARAIALKPDFIVCDEPVSALDVSIRGRIIDLLEELQEDFNISYLFIAHDLAAVKRISDNVAVMFRGKIVETAETNSFYNNPLHPYSQDLIAAAPVPDPNAKPNRARKIIDNANDQSSNGAGCDYAGRCSMAIKECKLKTPELREVETGHFVSCDLVG